MLQSQRNAAALCARHTESKPVEKPFDAWCEDELRKAMAADPACKGAQVPKVEKAQNARMARAARKTDMILSTLRQKGPQTQRRLQKLLQGEDMGCIPHTLDRMRREGLVRCRRDEGGNAMPGKWELVE